MTKHSENMARFPSAFLSLKRGWYTAAEIAEHCGYSYKYCIVTLNRMPLETKRFAGHDCLGRKRSNRKKWFWPGHKEYVENWRKIK